MARGIHVMGGRGAMTHGYTTNNDNNENNENNEKQFKNKVNDYSEM